MATDKRNEILTTSISEVHALITHGVHVIERQVARLKNVSHHEARSAVSEFERILQTQKAMVETRIAAIGGGNATQQVRDAVSAVADVAAGVLNAVRPSETVKSIRDDDTFFSQLAVAWLMLHTTSLSLGDIETANMAERGYTEAARCLMHLDRILPRLVVQELRESVKAADVEEQTRHMVMAAWNREASGSVSVGTNPTWPSVF